MLFNKHNYYRVITGKLLGVSFMVSCLLFCTTIKVRAEEDIQSKIGVPSSKVDVAGHDGLYANDPMIKISALPIDKNIDDILVSISEDISNETGLNKEFITYYWQTLSNINCMGKKRIDGPILVDLYVPGFLTSDMIGKIMTSLAESLERHTGLDKKWVFIHTHFPRQNDVYLSGQIQHGDDYQGSK